MHAGDMRGVETMLTAQAVALNTIFSELARRAAVNMGELLTATETYMRMALKAQTQCRATLETLAALGWIIARASALAPGREDWLV